MALYSAAEIFFVGSEIRPRTLLLETDAILLATRGDRPDSLGNSGLNSPRHRSYSRMHDHRQSFEALALPHMDAAYNLARWLSRSPTDAEDIV